MVDSISAAYERPRMPWTVILNDTDGFTHPSSVIIEGISAEGRLPYHSIFSQGMMRKWIEEDWATSDLELKKEACLCSLIGGRLELLV